MTKEYFLLNVEAPMVSFGSPRIDNRAPTYDVPTKSSLVGLIGNAFGVDARDVSWLQRLQDNIDLAYGVVRPGRSFVDYQTADFSKPYMGGADGNSGWSSSGKIVRRESSVDVLSNRRQLWKGYISDPHIVVAMWFVDQHLFTEPELDQALTYPRRVLYWGRKSCVPSGDIYRGSVFANSPVDALKGVSGLKFNKFLVPLDGPVPPGSSLVQMSSNRDWRVDRHGGNSVYQVVLP